MVERIIEYCARHRTLVFAVAAALIGLSVWAIGRVPLDAIPDLSDTQVIVWSEWMGRGPNLVEDQITYPVVTTLMSAPRVKTVRGYSMFGMSFVYVLFEDGTDLYWARSRVLEYLDRIQSDLPSGVNPVLGPDATGVGWVYQYALVDESGKHDLAELRSLQDYWIRYALQSVPGVAEVASVGGFERQYQVTLDPDRLRAYGLPLSTIMDAIRRSNSDVGGRVVEMSGREYVVRGLGYLHSTQDLESVTVGQDGRGTPIRLKDVANVSIGPDIRRGVAELDGLGEVAGGIVVMRDKENALSVIERVKDRIKNEIEPSLPEGVKIVPTYDRSELIRASIHTLVHTLIEEAIVVSLIIILFLLHVRSALVAIITLPIAVLVSFVPMLFLGLSSNIMSLGGIAIAIGAMVDASIVLIENAHKRLEHAPPDADRLGVVIEAAKEVGRPIFFSLILISVSFLPVFTLEGQGGRLFIPLAYTKTAAMFFAAVLSITLAPALMAVLIRGKIYAETEHPVSRVLIRLYRPFVYVALHNPRTTLLLAAAAVASAIPLGVRLGSEFMPPLNEGSLLYMPTTLPGISIEQARQSLQIQDRIIRSFPEVERVFGKAGRAETPTDPAPLDMVETTILLKPRDQWPPVSDERWYSHRAPDFLKPALRLLWPDQRPRTWAELTQALNDALNVPGWTNSLSPPIKTRIDMLTTGIRTPIGIKVYGQDLDQIGRVSEQLERTLKTIPGTRGVFAERTTGGYFLDITPRRDVIARYGLNVGDVQDVIEAALGGEVVTRTVEGRERYTVNVRYPRDERADLESIRRILVPIRTGNGVAASGSSGGSGGMGMSAAPTAVRTVQNDDWEDAVRAASVATGVRLAQAGASDAGMGGMGMGGSGGAGGSSGSKAGSSGGSGLSSPPMFTPPAWSSGDVGPFVAPGSMGGGGTAPSGVPTGAGEGGVPMALLGELADISLSTGPPMIKDENGSLVGYVYVDIDTGRRDVGGYVDEAKALVRDKLGPMPGVRLQWTGQYELLERMAARLRVVVPLTLAIIVLLLYLNFRSWVETAIVMVSVPFALVGSVWLMTLLGYNTSIAVWVGVIALVGVAAETGIVMIMYLDEFYHRDKAAGNMNTPEDIRRAVTDGAVLRVRPKLMTVTTTTIGLVPLLWAQGTGADVMGRIAAPMVGGLITSTFLTLEIIPVLYLYWKRLELRGEVFRGSMVALHALSGLVGLGLVVAVSGFYPLRLAGLLAAAGLAVLGLRLWDGGRTTRLMLAGLDGALALAVTMGLVLLHSPAPAYLAALVPAALGANLYWNDQAAHLDRPPTPEAA